MTRRQEIITTLLDWYEAVLNSWRNGYCSDSDGFPFTNPVLNHPSYRELERLLGLMHTAEPEVYWNITQRYLYAPSKIVYRCSKCGPPPEAIEAGLIHSKDEAQPPFGVDLDHKHGDKVVSLRPCRVRVPSKAIRPEFVSTGIQWLDENWLGEPFVPDFEAKAA